MYAGFSVAMVRPHETPPGQTGKLMRFPFTSFKARRKRAGGFSRASLGNFRKVLGQGNPPFGPTQSGSGVVAKSELPGEATPVPWNRVSAVKFPELSKSPVAADLGKVVSP